MPFPPGAILDVTNIERTLVDLVVRPPGNTSCRSSSVPGHRLTKTVRPPDDTFEKRYRIGEPARIWGLRPETVRKLVKASSR